MATLNKDIKMKITTISTSLLFTLVILLSGCVSPKFTGSAIPENILTAKPQVLVINDAETRDGFQHAVEGWLDSEEIRYVVKPEGVEHDPQQLTIEYVGYWSWDLALFLSRAEIEAFYQGQRVSKITYNAPSTLHTAKFGDADERIKLMLDVMFANKSLQEATDKL